MAPSESVKPKKRYHNTDSQKKGGRRLHELHPTHAKESGSKGGKATVENHPEMKTSEWGKWLVSHRGKRIEQVQYPSTAFSNLVGEVCPPLRRVFNWQTIQDPTCMACKGPPFGSKCYFREFLTYKTNKEMLWLAHAKETLEILRASLSNPEALKSAREEYAQQKTSPH